MLDIIVVIRIIILENDESTRIKYILTYNPSFVSVTVFDASEKPAGRNMTHQNDSIYDNGFLKRNPNKKQFVDSDHNSNLCLR